MKRVCVLKHSRMLSVPVVGIFTYFCQLMLVHLGLTHTFYLSGKKQRYMDTIIRILELHQEQFICKTYHAGEVLRFFSKQIMFDAETHALQLSNKEVYYSVLWTLVFCQSMSHQAKKSLAAALKKQ